MFDIILLNIIFILIPILIYIIYSVYENVFGNKSNNLFFGFAIISSVYLITKYSIDFNYLTSIISVLLIICIIKDKKYLYIIFGIYLSICYGLNSNYSILIFIAKYSIEIVIVSNVFNKFEYKIILFYLIECVLDICIGIDYSGVILSHILYALLSYILIVVMNRTDKIIDIYGTIRRVEYEKNFRDSLFKITHEIKNPIAVCKGYLDMLDPNNSTQVNKYISIVKEEIDRTLILMNDFLNLTKLKIDKSIMDISLLIEDIIRNTEALLLELNIEFEYNIIDDDIYIDGDYNRLKQVLINLIKNSAESINNNGLIKLNMKTTNTKVIIIIEDNGIGMSKDVINRVGEPFFTTKTKGTGLGVKLSTEIIEQHDGLIKYTSKEGKGTKVKIELPLYKKIVD